MAEQSTWNTEKRNPATEHIDKLNTYDMLKVMNDQNKLVPEAVEKALPEIEKTVDKAAWSISNGGRLIYAGAGTSGRLGVLDAAECPPTFGVEDGLVTALIAGGMGAMLKAVEGAEDSPELGESDIKALKVTDKDTVIGISASGNAPYVLGVLKAAKEAGAFTAGICCNKGSKLEAAADVCIAAIVGPEVISGSTRLKAGTAQKLILNLISTGIMIKTGKVYGNLMINVRPTNKKLIKRAVGILKQIKDIPEAEAEELILRTGTIRDALKELGVNI